MIKGHAPCLDGNVNVRHVFHSALGKHQVDRCHKNRKNAYVASSPHRAKTKAKKYHSALQWTVMVSKI
jgi:adenylylsulfate kinase-like enzyme